MGLKEYFSVQLLFLYLDNEEREHKHRHVAFVSSTANQGSCHCWR